MAGAISLTWHGVSEFNARIGKKVEQVHEGSHTFVARGAALAERNMKARAGDGGRHKKGEPTNATQGSGPAVVSGDLRRSIRHSALVPWGDGGWETEIGPTIIYARRVELEYDYPFAGPGWDETVVDLPALSHLVWQEAWMR